MHELQSGLLIALLLLGCGAFDPLEEVRALHRAGLYEDSLEPLRELVETRPEDAQIHYLYGLALIRSGEPSLAQFPLERAMEDSEWLVSAGITLASGAIATHNQDTALQVLGKVLAAEPDNIQALVMRANAYILTRRHYEEALMDADRVLDLDPDNLPILPFRAVALLGLARIGEAGAALEDMERRYKEEGLEAGDTSRYCATRAVFALEKGDSNAADRIFKECLERFPTSTSLVNAAVQFHEANQRPERAIEILQAAVAASGGERNLLVALVLRLQATGKAEEAETLLRNATKSPQPVLASSAWVDLAGYLMEQEQRDEGIEAFQQALELIPDPSPQLLFQYADALLMSERYEEALKAAKRNPIPVYRALIEGRVFLAQGDAAKALKRFSDGIIDWPDHAAGRYYAGLAAESSGQIDRAIEEYRYSIRARSGGTDAQVRLARLHLAEGQLKHALTAIQHNLSASPRNLEGTLVELEILSHLGVAQRLPPRILEAVQPAEIWGRAVAALAAGARARNGPEAGLATIESADRLDLANPASTPALDALIEDLVALGREEDAVERAAAIAEKRPDVAAFHVIHGLALDANSADPGQVRAAYDRALELEPENAGALAGIARIIAGSGDADSALRLLERAAAAAPDEPEYGRAIAEQLIVLERSDEAEARLEEHLFRHATDAEAALRLAQLREERGAERETTKALARRAVRFGGGDEARAFLDRVAGSGS